MRTETYHDGMLMYPRRRLTELDLRGNKIQSVSNLHRLRALKSLDLSKSLVSVTKGNANSCRFE